MRRFIYKLKFLTPVRFGIDKGSPNLAASRYTCHADTFFSAICHEWLNLYGIQALERLVSLTKNNKFLISDLMPYYKHILYLPKPILYQRRKTDKQQNNKDMTDRKVIKKLSYVPVRHFNEYIKMQRQGGLLPFKPFDGAVQVINTRNAITGLWEAEPYLVSAYSFKEEAGLYFVVFMQDDNIVELFDKAIESLGLSGIGAKRSSGFGKFELYDDKWELYNSVLDSVYSDEDILNNFLHADGDYYMNISNIAPTYEELKKFDKGNSYYKLIKRSGFVQSTSYAKHFVKRKQVVMFDSGSCFLDKLKGQVLDLSKEGNHPVYRYGKAIYIGVSL
ncbi:MAG: type III-A CRISPR-associated RAMP protein Csm4 [Clostridia bacterium]|nr:type III-A CRISPR-associated RAMP protein Csm4 [Clostridia bacterium]